MLVASYPLVCFFNSFGCDILYRTINDIRLLQSQEVAYPTSNAAMEDEHPINEIGSSRMARRTFIANIYNKVPDPNVIGSMTGHVEGSRAFARYRTIEEEVKKSLVDILG